MTLTTLGEGQIFSCYSLIQVIISKTITLMDISGSNVYLRFESFLTDLKLSLTAACSVICLRWHKVPYYMFLDIKCSFVFPNYLGVDSFIYGVTAEGSLVIFHNVKLMKVNKYF